MKIQRKKDGDYLKLKDGQTARFKGYSGEGQEQYELPDGRTLDTYDLQKKGLI